MSVARAEESATGNVTTGDRAGAEAQAPAPARRRRRRRHDWQGYLYILPAVAVFSLFVLVPLVQTVRLSFFDWDGLTLPRYVGWSNYTQMFRDPLVLQSYLHAVILILFYCVLPVLLGLMLSAVLSRRPLRGFGFFRTVLFLPQVIASVVVGVVWRFIYAPSGPLNQLLSAVGLQRISRAWLSDFTYSLPAIGFVGTWVLTGLCLILILAGIQQIPTDLYDAVRVDGGGAIREFFTVTLPGLRNVVVVCVALTLIAALRTFDLIYVTTRGGPGTSTMVPGLLIYQSAFGDQRDGYAAAIATVLMIVVFAVTFVTLRMSERVK
jgi:raffinose/stachyose/melibiose transport system permease protein